MTRTLVRPLLLASLALAAADVWGSAPQVDATGVIEVRAGGLHTCALLGSGDVACWGLNLSGQLGSTKDALFRTTPFVVSGLTSTVTSIDAGLHHTCALMDSGEVFCWGDNAWGQLGDGTTADRATPEPVAGLSNVAIAISTGAYHTCALLATGSMKCWGRNEEGQLGDGVGGDFNDFSTGPVDVVGFKEPIEGISAGGLNSCAITLGGQLKCWGDNRWRQLADGTDLERNAPVDVAGLESNIAAVAAGSHSCALTYKGGVWCWGANIRGQVGNGTITQMPPFAKASPVPVVGLDNGVEAVAVGEAHSCALLSSGTAVCWGSDRTGELGGAAGEVCSPLGSPEPCSSTPIQVQDLEASVLTAITTGARHSCVLTASASLKCWGFNGYGNLGDSTYLNRDLPVRVLGLGEQPDADDDGCLDERELLSNLSQGGLRNPKDFWDFFDTPDEANARDRVVSVADIWRIVQRFGSNGDFATDPLSAPTSLRQYHTAFDRTFAGPEAWRTGPPNGSITIEDIMLSAAQFGHSCA